MCRSPEVHNQPPGPGAGVPRAELARVLERMRRRATNGTVPSVALTDSIADLSAALGAEDPMPSWVEPVYEEVKRWPVPPLDTTEPPPMLVDRHFTLDPPRTP